MQKHVNFWHMFTPADKPVKLWLALVSKYICRCVEFKYMYVYVCVCLNCIRNSVDSTNMISKISRAINNSIECSAHFGRDPKQLVKQKVSVSARLFLIRHVAS